jgi:predicted N-acyltransferase
MTLQIRVYNTVDDIGKESIDSIADDGFFTYGWFKTLEVSNPFNLKPFYLAVYDGSRIVAVAPCIKVNLSQNSLLKNNFLAKQAMNLNKNFKLYNDIILICYSPMSLHGKVLADPNYSRGAILDSVCWKISHICKKERLLFSSFLYVSQFEQLLIENLENYGYHRFPCKPTMSLDIQWTSFNDYIESLKHKVTRNAKREIRKFEESGITIEEANNFGSIASILAALNSNLYLRHTNRADNPYDSSFFRNLSLYNRDNTKVFIAKKQGEIVGFSIALMHKKVMDILTCGFNYEIITNKDFVYFNIVYNEPIKFAIANGLDRIHFRIAAENIKLKRGCKSEETYSFVKCHNQVLGFLFNLYLKKKPLHFDL